LCIGFHEAVDDCALSVIKLHGHPFTWIKSPGTNRVLEERLDMAMGNSEWLQRFPEVKLTNFFTFHSDHTPILLDIIPTVRQRYNYSFKFENSWLLEDDIEEVVVDGWGGIMRLELGDRVVNCSTKLQSWGRRKSIRLNEWYDVYAIRHNPREACSTTCTGGGLLEAKSKNALVERRGHEY